MFDIIVIGGGASGLMSAIFACMQGAKVCVLESNTKLGKKILVTGNGRCNLTNQDISEKHYNNPHVNDVFSKFDLFQTLDFFMGIGIQTYSDEEGRIYPLSESAKDVALALELKLKSFQPTIHTSTTVLSISMTNNGFEVFTNQGNFSSKNIIVAGGAQTAQALLYDTPHTFQPITPVLTGYECVGKHFKTLAGVRADAYLHIESNGEVFEEFGQIQFRDNGISGIAMFNASAFLAKQKEHPELAYLKLLPHVRDLKTILVSKKHSANHLLVEHLLLGLLPSPLASVVLQQSGLEHMLHTPIQTLSGEQLDTVVKRIQHFPLQFVKPFGEAQVLSGGIPLSELSGAQSKFVSGLFVCGESAHVFGKSGGYNLQWAWSSGAVAGMQAGQRSKE